MVLKFEEFINESLHISFDKMSIEDLYEWMMHNYEQLGDDTIDLSSDGMEIDTPVMKGGRKVQLEPLTGKPNAIFSIDVPSELQTYVADGTYDDIDDAEFEDKYVRFLDTSDWTNSHIIDFIDGMLKNVPDPALRRK